MLKGKKHGVSPSLFLPAEGYFQKPGKKCVEKSCSDSSSDCGSSSGSVRASRGSWGSWSSSSSEGDKKPGGTPQHFLPAGESKNGPPTRSETYESRPCPRDGHS